jgi:hypothetical protein
LRARTLRERVRNLLHSVRIPLPEVRMREYPHQMSGGMRQRVVGAIAMAGGPKLIIADEPTTNLTIQAQYLDVLKASRWSASRDQARWRPAPSIRVFEIKEALGGGWLLVLPDVAFSNDRSRSNGRSIDVRDKAM